MKRLWLLVALAVFMMIFTVISVTTFNRNDRDLFGYKAYIVNSDSMAKTDFGAGDLIFVKETDPAELKEGDIIEVFINDVGKKGDGTGKFMDYLIVVPGTVKGATVHAKITKISAKTAFASRTTEATTR